MDENSNNGRKFHSASYRSLARCKHYYDSNDIYLKENFQNKGANIRRNIYNNEKESNGKKKQSRRFSLNKAEYYTEVFDYNNGMFDGKHFHFEKKWIKKKEYDRFIEKNRRIRDIALKKIKFRSYGLGVVIFLIFFILGVGISISSGIKYLDTLWDSIKNEDFWKILDLASKDLNGILGGYTYIIFFCILMFILAVMVI
ncbi:Plasmodium exported protein (Pm-fam-a like), unknown function, partial [Plasmodium malariae]